MCNERMNAMKNYMMGMNRQHAVMPTGMPAGQYYTYPGHQLASVPAQQITSVPAPPPPAEIAPQTLTSVMYTPGYLKTQIGRKVKIEFLIGTNLVVDREGTLVDVGASYVIIQETETDDLLLADLYSIKFVKFYY